MTATIFTANEEVAVPNGTAVEDLGTQSRGLTARESDVLQLLYRERTSSISKSLVVSESVVRSHLSAFYRTVGVHLKSELLALVVAFGRKSSDSDAWPAGRSGKLGP